MALGARALAGRGAGAIHAGRLAHRLAARGKGVVRVVVADLAVALFGVQAVAVGAAARADWVALPGLAQPRRMAGVALALVGRHTVAADAGVLADRHANLQLLVPLVADVAHALSPSAQCPFVQSSEQIGWHTVREPFTNW